MPFLSILESKFKSMKTFFIASFEFTLLCILLACSKDTDHIDTIENDSTDFQIIHIEFHESDPIDFFLPVYYEVEGKFTLTDSTGRKIDYNIIGGDNTIEVPYGTYKGKVHGFLGFTNDSLDVKSPGNENSGTYKAAIGRIPNFKYKILSHEVENSWYYLNTKCDTNLGYYTFSVWGSDDDTITTKSFYKIAAYHRAIDTNGNVRLLIADLNLNDPLYKYYNISVASLYGYMEDTVFTSWYTRLNQ